MAAARPVLFQRRFGAESRAISHGTIRKMIQAALADTGLIDPIDGRPLNYTPHDFRRLFITDAILNGLPPHIAQVIAGHRDINVTMGYKAIYPEESIQAHLAFLARPRSLRPARNIGFRPPRNGRSSSATSSGASRGGPSKPHHPSRALTPWIRTLQDRQ
ncbi:tyrosine-type recombinase/integrase [Nonomuraea angiospora]|uniref:Integrase n=1 Tax=Nonomuraea angiospora TaxID=46172 RepID=A0ABR9MEB2_9ACTN|nr:site-specific integrase [Nonomuraea angiospora]MBE1591257.1 integrase [Nonomuraea angiospora]